VSGEATEEAFEPGLLYRIPLDIKDRRHRGDAGIHILDWRIVARCKGAAVIKAVLNMKQ
jgi:hypothetical protein